jgi:hypothetical protein
MRADAPRVPDEARARAGKDDRAIGALRATL